MEKYPTRRGTHILDALDTVADRHGSTQATVALAGLITRPDVTPPIAGATSPVDQSTSLAAAVLLMLTGADLHLLVAASAWRNG